MNAADRSSMYKAKSKGSRQNADITEKTRARRDKRQNQYNDNRTIAQTPEKTSEQPSKVKRNRQQEFRDKFEIYLKKKAELKQKTKPKPFVSAVANGKYFESTLAPAVRSSPKKKKKQPPSELKDLMPKELKTDKPSGNGFAVNIYERPFVFTRSRAKAEALKSESTKPSVAIAKEKIEKIVRTKPVIAKIVKPQKPVATQKFVKPTTSKAIKATETKIIKTTETKAKKPAASKTPQSKVVTKTDKHHTNGTNARSSIVTSTVVKPKKHSSINGIEQIFDQSTSPIDDIKPASVPQVVELKQQQNPQNMCFVSPCVKLLKGKLNGESKKEKVTPNSINTPEAHSSGFESGMSYLSPFVTISRGGRTSSRKEKSARDSKYVLESRKSLLFNQSVEDRQKMEAAAYFRLQVKQETDRFNNLIANWQKIIEENDDSIPSECIDSINVAIGQTQLLTTSKFKQFSNLVTKFENDDVEQKILAEDLEGFWSMVYIQVEHCNRRFERLEKFKKNDWEDPELNIVKQKKLRRQNAMVTKPKKTTTKANSALTKMLLEARKNLKESKTKTIANQSTNMVITPIAMKLKGRLSMASGSKHSTPSKPAWIVS